MSVVRASVGAPDVKNEVAVFVFVHVTASWYWASP